MIRVRLCTGDQCGVPKAGGQSQEHRAVGLEGSKVGGPLENFEHGKPSLMVVSTNQSGSHKFGVRWSQRGRVMPVF